MPELEVVCERLGPRLVGRTVTGVTVSRRFGFLLRSPVAAFESALIGGTVTALRRRGKYVLLDVGAEAHLVVNPMLGGRLRVAPAGERATDSTLIRVGVGDEELRLTDSARMARVYLADGEAGLAAVPGLPELGPEAADIDLEEWRRRIRRHPGELKNLLRNQEFVAGVGNAYSDEILFAARVLPLRRRSTLSPAEVEELWEATGTTLREAVSAIRAQPAWAAEKQDRSFMRVHLRGGSTCVRCGHSIGEITARGEVTNFCRGCQH